MMVEGMQMRQFDVVFQCYYFFYNYMTKMKETLYILGKSFIIEPYRISNTRKNIFLTEEIEQLILEWKLQENIVRRE